MRFLLGRIGQGVSVIWGIVTLLFVIFYALGDPTEYLVEDNADADTKATIRAKYGLDQPLYIQYLQYLNHLSPLGVIEAEGAGWRILPVGAGRSFGFKAPDLGRSYQTQAPVASMISGRIGGTLTLALTAICFAALLGITLGVIAALRYDTVWDKTILTLSVLGISAPSYFIGVLIAWIFAVLLRPWTGLDVTGYMWEENIFSEGSHLVLKNLLLPALALGIRPLAVFIQLTRSAMLEVLSADYIRTARSKGLSPVRVVLQHALRNALNPVLTAITGWLAALLAGAFFIEYIFNWQGIGKLTIDALDTHDFPVIIGCALLVGLIFVGVNILTDVMYRWLDPRVRLDT
ncbi:MAG: ABC transporter permease [Bacteroidota bacterium]